MIKWFGFLYSEIECIKTVWHSQSQIQSSLLPIWKHSTMIVSYAHWQMICNYLHTTKFCLFSAFNSNILNLVFGNDFKTEKWDDNDQAHNLLA